MLVTNLNKIFRTKVWWFARVFQTVVGYMQICYIVAANWPLDVLWFARVFSNRRRLHANMLYRCRKLTFGQTLVWARFSKRQRFAFQYILIATTCLFTRRHVFGKTFTEPLLQTDVRLFVLVYKQDRSRKSDLHCTKLIFTTLLLTNEAPIRHVWTGVSYENETDVPLICARWYSLVFTKDGQNKEILARREIKRPEHWNC